MGVFDRRTDTEKEISKIDYNTNTEHESKLEYISADKKFAQKQADSTKKGICYTLIAMVIFAVIFVTIIIFSNYLSQSSFEKLVMYVVQPFIMGVFLLIGFAIIFIPKNINKKNKERCRYPVKAKILNIKREYSRTGGSEYDSRKHYVYIITYQYFYLGREYFIVRKQGGGEILNVGDEIDMFINKNDPEDYYIEDKIAELLCFIIGINWIFWTVIIIISTLLSC